MSDLQQLSTWHPGSTRSASLDSVPSEQLATDGSTARRARWRLRLARDAEFVSEITDAIRRLPGSEDSTASSQSLNRREETEQSAEPPSSTPSRRLNRVGVHLSFNSMGLFHVEARFEGTVMEVRDRDIVAHITEKIGSAEYTIAEIPLTDVQPHDRHLVSPGAIFYWLSGYEERPNWKRCMILTFAGYKRMDEAQIKAREQELIELLTDEADEA